MNAIYLQIHASEHRVAESLSRVAPIQHQQRQRTTQQLLNPIPYRVTAHGEKLHLDQNEKVVMYGMTHVVAVDGYLRKIVGFITLPVKNAIAIYDCLFRPLLQQEGLWVQVRVDHGSEFSLMLSVQQRLAGFRVRQDRVPYLQTVSRENHRAERIWPEVNQRINYPLKHLLIQMEANQIIDMRDEMVKFCVSWVTIRIAQPALVNFIQSWNSHRIPGRAGGIPNHLRRNDHLLARIPPLAVPSTAHAVMQFEQDGGQLTRESSFGTDPLSSYEHLQMLRERDFRCRYTSCSEVFENVLHGDQRMFINAVLFFIHLTKMFCNLVPT